MAKINSKHDFGSVYLGEGIWWKLDCRQRHFLDKFDRVRRPVQELPT